MGAQTGVDGPRFAMLFFHQIEVLRIPFNQDSLPAVALLEDQGVRSRFAV